jgi:gluconolactonase
MGRFIRTTTRNCEGGIAMHDQSKITRRRALQMAGAVAGLAAGGARGVRAQAQPQMQPRIERLAPEFDKSISVDEPIKELASGFGGSLGPAEGPLWWKEGGYLLFTDLPAHEIHAGQGRDRRSRADQPRERAHARSAGPAPLM